MLKDNEDTRIIEEFRIDLDANSSFIYDEKSKCYIRKNQINNVQKINNSMIPERFDKSRQIIVKYDNNLSKRIAFSALRSKLNISEEEEENYYD